MRLLLLFVCISLLKVGFAQKSMKNQHCDPATGMCTPAELNQKSSDTVIANNDFEIIYVGDPMCSWCYGIAPELEKLKSYGESTNIPFKIVVGGLRPGGGDPWTDQFKDFLRHEWDAINKRTGQEFGDKLFALDTFDYDTEPSCRALVTLRKFKPEQELAIFEAIQKKFYYDNEDPKKVVFYQSICNAFDIPFEEFKRLFESEELQKETYKEFILNREWGIKGYPSILLRKGNELFGLSNGFLPFDELKTRMEHYLKN